jgi:acetyl esterase/lipase
VSLRRLVLVLSHIAAAAVLAANASGAPAREPARVVELWPEGVPGLRADAAPETIRNGWVTGVHRPSLRLFPADGANTTGTFVLVCPGGGYSGTAEGKEGDEIAHWLAGLGIDTAVLRYRTKEYGHPAPLQDVQRAIRLVRSRPDEFGVRASVLGVMGFSAGGHLAGSAAVLHGAPEGRTDAPIDAVDARPNFAVLVYPVVTMDPAFGHAGSRDNLVGVQPSEDLVDFYSLEKQVAVTTPPLFIVSTVDDKTVPVANSVALFTAAQRIGVPVEMHLYETGPHGIGIREEHPAARLWPRALEAWLERRGWIVPR